MQRFLVPRSSLSSDAIQADLKAAHAATIARAAAQKKAQKRSDVCSQAPKKYWLQLGSAEKQQSVDIYVAKKMTMQSRPFHTMTNFWEPYIICSLSFRKSYRISCRGICRFKFVRHGISLSPVVEAPSYSIIRTKIYKLGSNNKTTSSSTMMSIGLCNHPRAFYFTIEE